MRISHLVSHLAVAVALAAPAMLFAQSAPEIIEQSVVEVTAAVSSPAPEAQVVQRIERGDSSEAGNWGDRDGGNRDNDGGERRRGGEERGTAPQQPQPQPDFRPQQRFDPPAQPVEPQIARNPFGRGGREGREERDGSTLNTSPPEAPIREARNDRDFGGERENRGDRFGDRGGNGPQIDTTPQRRPEGQVFDQNRDGRFRQGGRPDVNHDNRNGVFARGWQHDGDRFNGNRDGRFDRGRNGGSNHHFERHDGGWIDRGNHFGNEWNRDRGRDWNRDRDWNQNRNWNREWRGDRRYNWQGYRNQYRDYYRQPRYYNPYGYGYGYQRFGIGNVLNSLFFSNRYWINDPYEYRLPAAPYGYRWIRYYNDVLLVEQRSGYVVDVIYGFFW